MRDVVQVDVNRKSGEVEVEKAQRGSTLQDQFSLEERMSVKFGEQFAQAQDFFEIVGGKSSIKRKFCDLCRVEFHVRTEFVLSGKGYRGP